MPQMDGRALVEAIQHRFPTVPVIIITVLQDVETAIELMREGACDYLLKPFRLSQVKVAVERALERRRLLLENRRYRNRLIFERRLWRRRYSESERKFLELSILSVRSLVFSMEAKDPYTGHHSLRVGQMARKLAERMGLEPSFQDDLELAGHLHDIGKIGIRESVLLKPARLTLGEFRHIQQHPLIGDRILRPLRPLDRIRAFILHHHERFDGRGYPLGLQGEAIPWGARVLALADATDAMLSDRPYRPKTSLQYAFEEIRRNLGSQFDPELGKVLLELFETGEVEKLYLTSNPAPFPPAVFPPCPSF